MWRHFINPRPSRQWLVEREIEQETSPYMGQGGSTCSEKKEDDVYKRFGIVCTAAMGTYERYYDVSTWAAAYFPYIHV